MVIMRIQQFDYFLTASRVLNFSKAARIHYMTQQTFTNQIRSLEKEIGAPLFERDSDGWMLTAAGEVLQQRLPKVKTSISLMLKEVNEVSEGLESSLNIISLDGIVFGERYIQAVRRLHEENPRLNINASRSSYRGIHKALDGDACDAAVTMGYDLACRHDVEQIVLERTMPSLVVPRAHPLAQREVIEVRDLDGLDLYIPGDLTITPDQLLCEILNDGVRPVIHPMRNSSTAVLNVEMGLGATLHFGDTILAGNPHVAIRPFTNVEEYQVVLCWKSRNEKAALMRFVDLLCQSETDPA